MASKATPVLRTQLARPFAVDLEETADVAGVEDAGVIVEVNVVAECIARDARPLAVDAEQCVDVLGIKL